MIPSRGRAKAGNGAIAQLGERLHGMQEVGGSIPPGSTSLRSLRELRLGKPGKISGSEVSEGCHVVARRAKTAKASLKLRSAGSFLGGRVEHEIRLHWHLRTYTAFDDEGRAIAFEKYLKSGSARAF